jgi:hypothetical protein
VARPRLFVHLAEADSFAARLRAFVDFCETQAAAFSLGGVDHPRADGVVPGVFDRDERAGPRAIA